MTVIGPNRPLEGFHALQLKAALKLEIAGMKNSRGSAYAYIKKQYGFRGSKQAVFIQLTQHCIDNGWLPGPKEEPTT